MDCISPTNDLSFKKVFGSNEHKECLSGLIADFLAIEVAQEDIAIEQPYSIESYKEVESDAEVWKMHETIKDIAASLKFADFVSELQVKKQRFFAERILYYPFNRFCQNYNRYGQMQVDKRGNPNRYSSLRPVYALNILGESYFTGDGDALRVFRLCDPKRNEGFGKDLLRIAFFELHKPNVETINQQHWRDYFLTGKVRADAPAYIQKASQIIKIANLSEEEKRMAISLERVRADWDASMSDAYNDGKDAGRLEEQLKQQEERSRYQEEQLRHQVEKAEMVKAMLNGGLPLELVERSSGLTLEQIEMFRE